MERALPFAPVRRAGFSLLPVPPEDFRQAEERMPRQKLARRHNAAAACGFKLVPPLNDSPSAYGEATTYSFLKFKASPFRDST